MFSFIRRTVAAVYNLLTAMFLAVTLTILLSITLLVWLMNIFVYVFYGSAGKW